MSRGGPARPLLRQAPRKQPDESPVSKAALNKSAGDDAAALARNRRRTGEVREPRFSRQNPEQRRREIVAAAIRCLAKGGVGAFTVSEICAEAGISHGLINHYFPSKEDLLVATYDTVAEVLVQATRDAVSRTQRLPEDKLTAIVESSFAGAIFNEANLAVWLALWGQVRTHEGLRRKHNELYEGYRATIARIIGQIAAKRGLAVEGAPLALALTALIDGLWLEYSLNPTVFSVENARRSCYLLLEDRLGPLSADQGKCGGTR